MARRATNRREALEVEAELSTYQRKIADQAREIKALKEKLATQHDLHAEAMTRVTAERDEGISPMLTVVQQENRKLRDERDGAVARARESQRRWTDLLDRMIVLLSSLAKVSKMEAFEMCMEGAGLGRDFVVDWSGLGARHGFSADDLRRIERARGQRR